MKKLADRSPIMIEGSPFYRETPETARCVANGPLLKSPTLQKHYGANLL